MEKFRIGIDLGGTKTEAILLDPSDSVRHRKRIKTPGAQGYSAILKSLSGLIAETRRHIPSGSACTIGIGIPGAICKNTQLVQNANTTCLIGKPFQNDLEAILNQKIHMENDANCFTLAESREGAAKGYDLVFGVIMGTGCGGGLYINWSIRKGLHQIAGEWGHFSIDPEGVDCYCGNRGCIETKISGSGVESAYLKKYKKALKMQEIVDGFRNKAPDCTDIFSRFLDDFGRSLGGLISILDPDAVVLGGGLSNIEELYSAGYNKVQQYAFHRQIETPVLKNKMGDSAGVYGAAWLGAE